MAQTALQADAPVVLLAIYEDAAFLRRLGSVCAGLRRPAVRLLPYDQVVEGIAGAVRRPVDVVLCAPHLGHTGPLELIHKLRHEGRRMPVIVAGPAAPEDKVAALIRGGAHTYLNIDHLSPVHLGRVLREAVRAHQEAEEEARLRRQLREASQLEALTTLTSGVAHDFNNLLTGIMGMLELAEREATSESQRDHLGRAHDQCRRMAALIGELARYTRRSQSAAAEPIALGPLIEQVASVMRAYAPARIAVEMRVAQPSPEVRATHVALYQPLRNIVHNALEACGEAGTVTIEARRMHVHDGLAFGGLGLAPGLYAVITVRDTGQGIAPEHLDRVFDPFFSTRNRTTQKGLGLGLTLAWDVVQDLGGTVRVHSIPGHGTTVRMFLPLEESPPEQAPTHAPGTETLLLADNDAPQRDALGALFERLGYTVYLAADGRDALQMAATCDYRIDGYLLDCNMPHHNGHECLAMLHEAAPRAPVIVLGAHLSDDDRRTLRAMGAGAVLTKPIETATLARVVRDLLDRAAQSAVH